MELTERDALLAHRAHFSKIGFAFFLFALLAAGVQLAGAYLVARFAPGVAGSQWYIWGLIALPTYLVGAPVCYFLLRRVPSESIEKRKLGVGNWLIMLVICLSVMYIGNLIGLLLMQLVGAVTGKSIMNLVSELILKANPYFAMVFAAILLPIAEEFFFRKLLLERLRRYGDKFAILVSALMFGLFHGNLFQFFYAFGLGMIFAYIYLKTGRLRYTALLHIVINTLGAVVAPFIAKIMVNLAPILSSPSRIEQNLSEVMAALPTLLLMGLYGLLLLGCTVAGVVLLIVRRKRIILQVGNCELPKGQKGRILFGNAGMICFLIVSVGMFALQFIQ